MKLRIFERENYNYRLINAVFRVALILFIALFLLEAVYPGFVVSWFNPVWVLIIVLISGSIVVIKN